MPEPTVPTAPSAVISTTSVGGLDQVTVVESLDRRDPTIRLRFHGAAGGVELVGRFDDLYSLILSADQQLARLYRPNDRRDL